MFQDQNVVYIGRKPVMSYVLAVMTHLNRPDATEVVLKARGNAITTAVDTAEVTRRRFMETLQIDKIDVGTEELTQQDGRTRAVSTIEITLKR
ncbi:MAG: DNA-binding protein Alba [Candidatus Bathyarchaeota archaeon]|nr:DNA-binding protein Alba [Candidatus Bathyarchaeota archaeon]